MLAAARGRGTFLMPEATFRLRVSCSEPSPFSPLSRHVAHAPPPLPLLEPITAPFRKVTGCTPVSFFPVFKNCLQSSKAVPSPVGSLPYVLRSV